MYKDGLIINATIKSLLIFLIRLKTGKIGLNMIDKLSIKFFVFEIFVFEFNFLL